MYTCGIRINAKLVKEGSFRINAKLVKEEVKVENDVLLNMEKGRVTAPTLLDLSAAFDTIDHLTLISRLSSWYGISGTALDWFTSYLSNRCQQVKIHDYISEAVYISFGVPQGSVHGPILFTLYTAPLSHVIAEHDV